MKAQVDENLSPALARALNALASTEGCEVIHVADYARGAADVDLFQHAAAAGIDLHITLDQHQRRRSEREAIDRFGLTVFVLAKGWDTLTLYDKAARLIEQWPAIADTASRVPPGRMFRVPHRRLGRIQPLPMR